MLLHSIFARTLLVHLGDNVNFSFYILVTNTLDYPMTFVGSTWYKGKFHVIWMGDLSEQLETYLCNPD